MHIKRITNYISISVIALLTIWSQSWLLFLVLIITIALTFHKGVKNRLSDTINKLTPAGKKIGSWLLAIAIASILLVTIDTYFFGIYTLRSSSMEPTFYSGNVFLMNKVQIGPAKSIEDVNSFKRLIGWEKLNYGNVIVFHFPEADTVFIHNKKENYHYKVREAKIKRNKNIISSFKDVQYMPVNERPRFIKRIVALPGDTLQIINGNYFINGKSSELNSLLVNRYIVDNSTPKDSLEKILGKAQTNYAEENNQIVEIQSNIVTTNHWETFLSKQERPLNMPDPYIFPFSNTSLWNASYWGPALVPQKGDTIEINSINLPLYLRIIEAYEGNNVKIKDGQLYIEDKLCKSYKFKMDYYWVAGDNRPHSFDSRYWGFVPDNHIIGMIDKFPFSD